MVMWDRSINTCMPSGCDRKRKCTFSLSTSPSLHRLAGTRNASLSGTWGWEQHTRNGAATRQKDPRPLTSALESQALPSKRNKLLCHLNHWQLKSFLHSSIFILGGKKKPKNKTTTKEKSRSHKGQNLTKPGDMGEHSVEVKFNL